MKKILFTTVVLAFCLTGFSQTISQITITGNGQVDIISFGLDENVQVYITKDGSISKWGFDRFIGYGYQENYRGELDPYAGRVEYYTQNDDESVRGKVKYIGRTLLTYFTSYERESLKGKLKSIGSFNLDYYLTVEDKAMAGNLKAIGQKSITWYASYENEALRGKLKAVGSTMLTYYGAFEDKAYRGKVKSIDRYNIIYYSSVEQFSGSIKNGQHILNANGIKFYLKNY
jgi:hypothetical protein